MTPARVACRVFALAAVVLGMRGAASAQFGGFQASLRTFSPAAPVQVQIRTSSPTDLAVDAIPVAVADVLAIRRNNDLVRLDELRAKPVRTVRDGIHPDLERGLLHDVRIGTLPRGYYVLAVHAGTGSSALLVDVTSLGVLATRTPHGVVAFAVDLQTMHARPGVTVERYAADSQVPQTRKTSSDGTAAFDDAPGVDVPVTSFVARDENGSSAVAQGAGSSAGTIGADENGVVQLDRPIYRPGHRVEYRAIVRDGMAGAYAIPAGTRTVSLRDPEARIVFTAQRELDAFGTVSGEIPLADDARLGTYAVMVGDANNSRVAAEFSVQDYVKPEFTIDVTPPATTVGGDDLRFTANARYLFGRPAAGLRLHYSGYYRSPYVWWRHGDPFRGASYDAGPPPVSGNVIVDAAGHATITVRTPAVHTEQTLNLDVDGIDDAGKTVTTNASAQLTPASFYLGVASSSYFIAAGDDVGLTIRSRTYTKDGIRAGVPVTLTFTPEYYAGGSEYRDEAAAETRKVVTDAGGSVTVRWKPVHDGYTEVRAHAVDERGRDVTTVIGLWVASVRYEHAYRVENVSIVPQKAAYRPGERAALLVTVPQVDVDALVRVTGGATETLTVRRLASQASTIEVDTPRDVARFRVTVIVPARRGFTEANSELAVEPAAHKLTVAIRPDKRKYAPGERARFGISVHDAAGLPVRAQVGIAVVDDAIFALRAGTAPDAFRTLYGYPGPFRRTSGSWNALDEPGSIWLYNRVLRTIGRTESRQSAQFVPGQTADMYNVGARQPSLEKLRNDFRDTAYWSPAIVTDAAGRAVASFDWPDSLTSFTASGIGVTQNSDVGSGSANALVSKDFLVRLSTPRFLRRGDTARFVALAQGTRNAKSALLRFSAPELGVADETTAVRFDANAGASKGWNVRASGDLGSASLRLAGTSGSLNDGLRVTLPVETSGTAQHERAAGSLPGAAVVSLRLGHGMDAGELRIDLAPSVVAQLLGDVRLLQVYPYYCVEQTMSAALPAIYVERLRKRAGIAAPAGPPPADIAKRAVDRLSQLQHSDGSWGWWEHDAANPFMTAYALYGLTELARDGYPVARDVLDRGAGSVVQQIAAKGDTLGLWGGTQQGSEANTRAFMLYALADAKPASVDRAILAKTDASAKDLNSYAVAVLGLAHLELGDRAGAQPLLTDLLKRVKDDGTYARWEGQGWHYRWEDDPIETTAYALRFVHAMNAGDPRVPRVVRWLRSQQRGSWFATTKDTAAAIYAMSETIAPESNELQPHETVRVVLDGRTLKRVRIDTPVLSRADASIVVPARALRRGGTLRFEREGTGALYWSTDWTRYAHDVTTVPADAPFHIARTLSSADGNEWHVGDVVDVDLRITADEDAQYVAIEDPLPAGLAYQPRQHETGDDWSGLQFFDDRVVFFAARLSRHSPLHLHYRLRATTAGRFTAPPPTAYAMYGPPSTAAGRAARITIR